jgi:hypothetical protein
MLVLSLAAATSVNFPAPLARAPDRKRFSGADNRGGVAAGRGADCKRLAAKDSGQAERLADSKDNGDCSSSDSGSECDRAILFGTNLEPAPTAKKSPHIETPIEFFTASPPMGPLLINPDEVMLFYTGPDTCPGSSKVIVINAHPIFGDKPHNLSDPARGHE